MKKELQVRLGVASFLQETLVELAKKKRGSSSDATSANATLHGKPVGLQPSLPLRPITPKNFSNFGIMAAMGKHRRGGNRAASRRRHALTHGLPMHTIGIGDAVVTMQKNLVFD